MELTRFDYPAIVENPAEFELVATDAATGKPVYFTKDDMKQDDYRAIMASCALPVMCRPISFHNETYFDGGLSDSVPIERAFAKGCDRVVVILSKPRSFVKQPEGFRHIYRHALRKISTDHKSPRQPASDVPPEYCRC